MKWVVDASVGAKWLLPEPESALAEALLDQELWVPDLFFAEVANILWKKLTRDEISLEAAGAATRWLECAPLNVRDCRSLVAEALTLANELGHPAYDCCYLALALAIGHPLVTADRRLFERCRSSGSAGLAAAVVWLPAMGNHDV